MCSLDRRGERDGNKRMRSNSGTRPAALSAINDTFDPLDIISMERADDGQVGSCTLTTHVRDLPHG
jgi:hypothetical protein